MTREQIETVNALAVATGPERYRLIEKLRTLGVPVSRNPAVQPEGPTPSGCARGRDGIIRNPRFSEQYRRVVIRRGQSDVRYRAEALALMRLARGRRPAIVHAPERREFAPKPRGSRRHRAHEPGRPSDDDPPEHDVASSLLRAITVEEFAAVLKRAGL
jgi:hypothetical protein